MSFELPYKLELPDDVLHIIKEYSMPLTRPDWRTLHRMTYKTLLVDFYYEIIKRTRYINNHPNRDAVDHAMQMCIYKNIFTEYIYVYIFDKN